MKKYLFIKIVLFSSSLVFTGTGYAQNSSPTIKLDRKTLISSAERVVATENADNNTLADLKSANAKLYNGFTSRFSSAYDILVFPLKKNVQITCMIDGISNRLLFSNDGKLLQTIRDYTPENLPKAISNLVRNSYPRYSIFGIVNEVTIGDATAHLVMIENKNSWKRVRVINGEIDVYEEYKKM